MFFFFKFIIYEIWIKDNNGLFSSNLEEVKGKVIVKNFTFQSDFSKANFIFMIDIPYTITI